MDYTVHGILQARILERVVFPFSRGSSQPRDWTQVSCITGGFFTSWTKGKPNNPGVVGLSLLQWIFPTQKSNRGLLHCRWILYQLSSQGSPEIQLKEINYLAMQLTSSTGDLGLGHLILPLAEVCCALWCMIQCYPSSIQCCLNIICIDNLIFASGQ